VDDARTGKRFPVELPIRIHVSDSKEEQAGTTANVSSSGVFIKAAPSSTAKRTANGKNSGKTRTDWRLGAVVEFEMTLPAKVIGARKDVQVQCSGRVVRVEKNKARSGVACVIDKYEFVRKS
jgi:hypothetical protein